MNQISMENRVVREDDEPPLLNKRVRVSPTRNVENLKKQYSKNFRKTFFPEATKTDWDDWHWQLSHRCTTLSLLERVLHLTNEERQALETPKTQLPFSITPYYLSLIDPDDLHDPLRKTVVPNICETLMSPGESLDPLHEDRTSPVPSIVHRYPDRVLFLATDFCSVYCRYCTRSRLVGGEDHLAQSHWKDAIAYITRNPVIRDVVISGGDPLTLSDEMLEYLLSEISRIPHVEIIRLGTKVPVVLPQRITPALVKMLKKYHPLYMSVHCTHPNEITDEAKLAFARLADHGIVLGSQTVLLQGVNDSIETMMELTHQLLKVRVKPYYLFQCDPIIGSAHFRTTVETGKNIIQGLRGFTSGYAIPQYVIDTPGGGGKVPILPNYEVGRIDNTLYLKNYEGKIFAYPDVVQQESSLC